MMRKFNCNFTKCRAKYKGHKEANYTFYIVDYTYGGWPIDKSHITELRNRRLIQTVYFMDKGKAGLFMHTEGGRIPISEANDRVFVKSAKKYIPKMIDNMFNKKEKEEK